MKRELLRTCTRALAATALPVSLTPASALRAPPPRVPALRHRLRRTLALVAALFTTFLTGAAPAQPYPNKPIRLVVGYPAGGGADALARLLATRLSDSLGQQVVVDNRPGASSAIASDNVAKSAPDGYTLYFADSAMLVVPSLSPKAGYDALKSFTPVSGVVTLPLVLMANPAIGANSLDGVIKLVQSNPGKFNYGSPGVGTIQHLAMELLKQRANLFIVHIPYRGAAPIIPDLISGQISFGVISAGPALAQAKSGKINAIAITSEAKLASALSVSGRARMSRAA